MTYQEIKQEESCYVMNTYGRYPVALEKGKGARLWDVEGKEYIDMASGIGVNCLGYGDWDLVKAVSEQASKLMHVSNLYTTIPMVKTAKTLVIFSGLENGKVFFANSGAEANEGAIKLARKIQLRPLRGGEKQDHHPEKFLPRPHGDHLEGHGAGQISPVFLPLHGGLRLRGAGRSGGFEE